MASNLIDPIAMASNLIDPIAMASNLTAMASNHWKAVSSYKECQVLPMTANVQS